MEKMFEELCILSTPGITEFLDPKRKICSIRPGEVQRLETLHAYIFHQHAKITVCMFRVEGFTSLLYLLEITRGYRGIL